MWDGGPDIHLTVSGGGHGPSWVAPPRQTAAVRRPGGVWKNCADESHSARLRAGTQTLPIYDLWARPVLQGLGVD